MPAAAGDCQGAGDIGLRANLLGPFSMTLGGTSAGPWVRPSAKRLCELLLISPRRRIGRRIASEALFSGLEAAAAANALSKALSMARAALSPLGSVAPRWLQADRNHIWFDGIVLEVDSELHEQALRAALGMLSGLGRDKAVVQALSQQGILLEDEPLADWAMRPREALESLRQEVRLTLARDRTRGFGRSGPEDVAQAWEACLSNDPTCEEAACALMRGYAARGGVVPVSVTYQRCRDALQALGLRASPALEETYASVAPTPAVAPSAAARLTHRGEGKRLVTVLFTELTMPMGTSQKLDPEDLRELVGGALAEVVAQVETFGGTVTSVSGAGLVAVFGAPESHEDDPERALRAAFRVVRGVGGRDDGLSLRAGVETGWAVVGSIGSGSWDHYEALGDVVGVAANLQTAAAPESILVGPVTSAATLSLFEWGPNEEVAVRAGAKPVLACYLHRPKVRPFGEVGRRRLGGSVPLIGRREELGLLREALRDATAGRGSVVLIVGEAGFGKTRLVDECRKLFTAWVGAASGRLPLWLAARAASYASSSPYGLYQQLMARWIAVAPEEGDEVVRVALERAMKALSIKRSDQNDEVALLAHMMGLSSGEGHAHLNRLDPERNQRATFAAVRSVVSHLMARGPTVLVLEDLHWADPTSLRLTEQLLPLGMDGPLLVVMTRRPEPGPGASDLERSLAPGLPVRKLALARLDPSVERDLTMALLGGKCTEEVVGYITHGTEGNPLFLEERLSSLLETGALTRNKGGWRVDHRVPGEVPEALERLVRSRADRLGPVPHQVALAASVLGSEFSIGALGAITDVDAELPTALSELCAGGLFAEVRSAPQPAYRFRHALIQEAIYKGLLRDQRRHLHLRAARGLEAAASDHVEDVAAELGRHYAAAGDPAQAARYLRLAGEKARASFANDEAITSYTLALELLGTDPGVLAAEAVELQMRLGDVFERLGRFAEARECYQEATRQALAQGPVLAARSYCWLGVLETRGHRFNEALSAFDAAGALLLESQYKDADDWVETWLDVQLGLAELYLWRNETDHGEAVLGRARPAIEARGTARQKAHFYGSVANQRARASSYTIDESILADCRAQVAAVVEGGLESEVYWAWMTLGVALLWHGDLAAARAEIEEALGRARRAGDKFFELQCLTYLGCSQLRRHDVTAVKELSRQSEELARAFASPEDLGMAWAMMSWVAWREDRLADAERLAHDALEHWRVHAGPLPLLLGCPVAPRCRPAR